MPLARTTLRGTKIHTAIAGKGLEELPVRQRDSIGHLLSSKTRSGKGKYEQIELAIVISEDDIKQIEKNKQNHDNSDMDDLDMDNFTSTSVRVS